MPETCLPKISGSGVLLGGVASTDFALTHDYRGKPRRVEANQGVVAADHGRCSDIGK